MLTREQWHIFRMIATSPSLWIDQYQRLLPREYDVEMFDRVMTDLNELTLVDCGYHGWFLTKNGKSVYANGGKL